MKTITTALITLCAVGALAWAGLTCFRAGWDSAQRHGGGDQQWLDGANHAHDRLLNTIETACQGGGLIVVEDRQYICTPRSNMRL